MSQRVGGLAQNMAFWTQAVPSEESPCAQYCLLAVRLPRGQSHCSVKGLAFSQEAAFFCSSLLLGRVAPALLLSSQPRGALAWRGH